MSSILNKLKKEMGNRNTIMVGREKGQLPLDIEVKIKDFNFLKNKTDNTEYGVVLLQDYPFFYFTGAIVCEKLRKIEEILTDAELEDLLEEGIPVKFGLKISEKTRRNYIDMEIL